MTQHICGNCYHRWIDDHIESFCPECLEGSAKVPQEEVFDVLGEISMYGYASTSNHLVAEIYKITGYNIMYSVDGDTYIIRKKE